MNEAQQTTNHRTHQLADLLLSSCALLPGPTWHAADEAGAKLPMHVVVSQPRIGSGPLLTRLHARPRFVSDARESLPNAHALSLNVTLLFGRGASQKGAGLGGTRETIGGTRAPEGTSPSFSFISAQETKQKTVFAFEMQNSQRAFFSVFGMCPRYPPPPGCGTGE